VPCTTEVEGITVMALGGGGIVAATQPWLLPSLKS
jgi:hypothetical protein